MQKKLILLFSHSLNDLQKKDTREQLGITKFINLPERLQKQWSNIPADEVNIINYLSEIRQWLFDVAEQGDHILIQGDFGATCYFVNWAFNNKLIPVYSTTKRIHKEFKKPDGSIESVKLFQHRIFRKYII